MFRSRSEQSPVVIGLFPYASEARRALVALTEHHFSASEISAAFRSTTPAAAAEPVPPIGGNSQWFGQLRQIYHGDDRPTIARDPEIAPAAGPGEFESMLAQLDLSPQDASILDSGLGRGAAIVAVRAGDRNPEARSLLEQRGAHILDGRNSETQRIMDGRNSETPSISVSLPGQTVTSTPFSSPQPTEPGHIQLFGEVLRVRKEKVSGREVHVRKESVTHMETVQVPVTREHLVVEQADENGHSIAENTIRVPLSEERVHIDKDTVLREEYKVGKREITQNESVSDSVRRERLLIDDAREEPVD